MSKHGGYAITDADFKQFTVLWNQHLGLETPDIHFRMVEWLERCWVTKARRLLLMAFRSSGKSTLVGLFAAWLLYRNADLRILVLAADFTLAKKMARNVKHNNIIQICQKPYQFSCWNRADPNFKKLQAADAKDLYFATALRIARRAVIGRLADATGGATHYHAKSVSPYWAKGETPTVQIGNHIFYRLV